jgi:hypothetical protein
LRLNSKQKAALRKSISRSRHGSSACHVKVSGLTYFLHGTIALELNAPEDPAQNLYEILDGPVNKKNKMKTVTSPGEDQFWIWQDGRIYWQITIRTLSFKQLRLFLTMKEATIKKLHVVYGAAPMRLLKEASRKKGGFLGEIAKHKFGDRSHKLTESELTGSSLVMLNRERGEARISLLRRFLVKVHREANDIMERFTQTRTSASSDSRPPLTVNVSDPT